MNKLYYSVAVPSDGGSITFEAMGMNASNGFVSEVTSDLFTYHKTNEENSKQLPYTICDQAWGGVTVDSRTPHTTTVKFNANDSGKKRCMKITFGGAYTVAYINFEQATK